MSNPIIELTKEITKLKIERKEIEMNYLNDHRQYRAIEELIKNSTNEQIKDQNKGTLAKIKGEQYHRRLLLKVLNDDINELKNELNLLKYPNSNPTMF